MKHWMIGAALPLLMACGGETAVPPESRLAEAEAYAESVEETIARKLAYRSLAGYSKGDSRWNATVGYHNDKPAMVRLLPADGRPEKWWLFADSATGKVLYFKEETQRDGRKVLNRFTYLGDSLVYALANNDPYVSPYGELDFRLKGAEVQQVWDEVVKAVEADQPELSAEANAARRQNAQFYATGGKDGWHMVINPSISSVTLQAAGAEPRSFGYDMPTTGAGGESIYSFGSLQGKLEVKIWSKSCASSDGRTYPYTVTATVDGKTLNGCGTLLQ